MGATALREALSELTPPREGYLQLSHADKDVVVFFYAGAPFQAGVCESDRFFPLPLGELKHALDGAVDARVVATDLATFLCGAVLFRKAPAAHIPAALVDGETVLKNVAALGKDAVVAVARGSARSFVFCRGGKPVKLYAAVGEEFAADGSIADRVVDYVYRHKDEPGAGVTLDLYDDIHLQAASGAHKPLMTYLQPPAPEAQPQPPQPPAWIIVRLGGRVVFRFPVVAGEEVVVGRGDEAALVLDNLSVSRRHAKIVREGETLVVTDLGSENGLVQRGERRERVVLHPGDDVDVGKYTLSLSRYAAAGADEAPVRPRARSSSAGLETIAVPRNAGISLEHEGRSVKVPGAVFVIGAGDSAHLRIDGWFVADTHVVLAQHQDGWWRATWSAGWRPLRVNGKKTRQARLQDGDVLAVGSHVVVFRGPAGAQPAAQRGSA